MSFEIMIEMAIGIGLIATTTLLFAIVLLAYRRIRTTRMLFVTLGFGTFFIAAILHIPKILSEQYSFMMPENVFLLFQLVGLIFIVIGVLKD